MCVVNAQVLASLSPGKEQAAQWKTFPSAGYGRRAQGFTCPVPK